MNKVIAPIVFGDKSKAVADLQNALTALGYQINPDELDNQTAGGSTIKAIREIKIKNRLRFDNTFLVDQPIADFLNKLLKDKGLLDDGLRFIVSGRVFNSADQSIPGVTVIANDKDHIQATPLGSAVTNADGFYQITYDPAQVKTEGKPAVDLVVKAYNAAGNTIATSSIITADKLQAVETVNLQVQDNGVQKDFKVSGRVFNSFGQPLGDKSIVAFDVDLKGAAIYSTVTSLKKIADYGGFELLGETVTNADGYYEIPFTSAQFKQSEKGLADVIVFVNEADTIIARSRLCGDEDYIDGAEIKQLDIVLEGFDQRGKSEYARLMEEVDPFVKMSGLELFQLNESTEQIQFLAKETNQSLQLVTLLVQAANLISGKMDDVLSHELVYGISRQDIVLSWIELSVTSEEKIKKAIQQSVTDNIIAAFPDADISNFMQRMYEIATSVALSHPAESGQPSIGEVLNLSIKDPQLQTSFFNAYRNFNGPIQKFWTEDLTKQPGFERRPDLINAIQLTNQLASLSGNFFPLVRELIENQAIKDIMGLLRYNDEEWNGLLQKTGVPPEVQGATDEGKINYYRDQLKSTLYGAYPTQKIALMISSDELKIEDAGIKDGLIAFFDQTKDFDIASSRIINFRDQVAKIAGENQTLVEEYLATIQRLFQVSPTLATMAKLLDLGLNSAYQIANIPRQAFIDQHAMVIGGEENAMAVHQKATYQAMRLQHLAMTCSELIQGAMPNMINLPQDMVITGFNLPFPGATSGGTSTVQSIIAQNIPNYNSLFGSPDICDCKDCRSVYSPASYLVDILQFLAKLNPNKDQKTPLDIFHCRRPDIEHLLLTCENTNTLIPYIDLVNEVLEFYIAHNNNLEKLPAYDTGDAMADELRADPQNILEKAYAVLSEAVFPLSLPYNQPLDAERIYFEQMNTSRAEIMEVFKTELPVPIPLPIVKAIAAEQLQLSEKEYTIITKSDFSGNIDTKNTWEYFGYQDDTSFQAGIYKVPEFLRRTGILYTDLISLLETKFINPGQPVLSFIEALYKGSKRSPAKIYSDMGMIVAGTLPDKDYPDLKSINLSNAEFKTWVESNFPAFQSVVTLFESSGACKLSTTKLQTIKGIYENKTSDIQDERFSKIHRFIRLWRKTGWSMADLDTIIFALGEEDITVELIDKIYLIKKIKQTTNIPLVNLATLWGDIQVFGNQTLYKKLFLNKTIQKLDTIFSTDEWGNVLFQNQGIAQKINDHLKAILVAFRLSENDFNLIKEDNNFNDKSDLNLTNLSVIYRYIVFSKALGLTIADLCLIKQLFDINPFSTYDSSLNKYTNINLQATLDFINLVTKIKSSGFKISTLNYIIKDISDPKHNLIPPDSLVQQAMLTIRKTFLAFDQDHPDTDTDKLTEDLLRTKMQLVFQQETVDRFLAILNGTALFTSISKSNLGIKIPSPQSNNITYLEVNGRLQCTGVMSDYDRKILTKLSNEKDFLDAVESLYQQPEEFLTHNFYSIDSLRMPSIIKDLLNRPQQNPPLIISKKWAEFYKVFLPYLKNQLRRNQIVQSIAGIIGLDESITQSLVENNLDKMVQQFSQTGLDGSYFQTSLFTNPLQPSIDDKINFAWGSNKPQKGILNAPFSVRWEGYINPSTSSDVTLIVSVDADDAFKLSLDGQLLKERKTGDVDLSKEYTIALSSAKMYLVKIEYISGNKNYDGIHFYWKTAASPKVVIESPFLYPLSIYDGFTKDLKKYQKAGLFISGFNLSGTEIEHLIRLNKNFDNIDFTALTTKSWQRIASYIQARSVLPGSSATLIDLFEVANISNVAQITDDVLTQLISVSGWDKELLKKITSYFGLTDADFRNELKIEKLSEAIKLTGKIGTTPDVIAGWLTQSANFKDLFTQSQSVKNTLKARFEDADWQEISKKLSNRLRENQRDALVSYLLVQKPIIDWGAQDADSLFEYFLIDVQMDSCMDTSRIKQAISSVQLFVSRCLLNLESIIDPNGKEIGVAPQQIDKSFWNWMQSITTWEANRKVFLYPENWLDPELRDDKSPFFKELESEMMQNDITKDNAENALYNYLNKLDEISHLEVCGMYQQFTDETESTYILHVFGRTHKQPYTYYYRTFDSSPEVWSAWAKIQVDIRSINDGPSIGVHLVPVVWKDRLFIFWPEFIKKQENNASTNGKTITDLSKDATVSNLQGVNYWDVSLAWSEFRNGNWSSKSISKNSLRPGYKTKRSTNNRQSTFLFNHAVFEEDLGNYKLVPSIDNSTQELVISLILNKPSMIYTRLVRNHGNFRLTDIRNPIFIENIANQEQLLDSAYSQQFLELEYKGPLTLQKNLYLQTSIDHKIFFSPQITDFEKTLKYPFFFSDNRRTYFIKKASNQNSKGIELDFYSFYHPGTSDFFQKLNRAGIDGLMKFEFTQFDDLGISFEMNYQPDTKDEFVHKPSDEEYKTSSFYKENVAFDEFSAYGIYNWELFYHVPLYIATRLSKNGKYSDAMQWFHYIFDPTTDEEPKSPNPEIRFWKVPPLRIPVTQTLEEYFKGLTSGTSVSAIEQWRKHPYKPFLVARGRPVAFMKNVVMRYIDNLVNWGDELFRQDSIESINQATQLYIIASHILGPKPQKIALRGEIKAESYHSLQSKLDAFSNAIVQLENIFPSSSAIPSANSVSSNLLSIGSTLYFCIPNNTKLLQYWDTVGDRLFKIRHCMNIEGVERSLALFEPSIDPGLLIKAAANGIKIGALLSNFNSPAPLYRFNYIMQKAVEFCSEVKALGNALLSALEKKDSESLSRIRAGQETSMLNLISEIKQRQVLEAKANIVSLQKSRETLLSRAKYYINDLLNKERDEPLTDLQPVKMSQDASSSLVSGVQLILREQEELNKSRLAFTKQEDVSQIEQLANLLHLIPDASMDAKPLGVGAGVRYGGMALGTAMSAFSRYVQGLASTYSFEAGQASKMSSFIRREQEWTQQANQTLLEIAQIDKQLIAAEIRQQIAEKDLYNHQQQIINSQAIENFLTGFDGNGFDLKFSTVEFYQWMKEQLFSVYKQSYQMAYDMAKKTEKAYQFELGLTKSDFIQYGYFNSNYQGLTSGEQLHFALRQMEKSYLEENRRELELTKSISMALLNPLALQELRTTGKCFLKVLEELYDLDFQGHYFRRIKSVSLSLPCIAGPYTTVNCTLRLLKNIIRFNTLMNDVGTYEHNNDDGAWTDDSDRFRENNVPVKAIATSTGQHDSGMFELNFRDERYLPFEGAGAISEWGIELTQEAELRQFDYSTIADVILHIHYTAREDAGSFKANAVKYLKLFLERVSGQSPLLRMFSMKQEFSTEWHKFLYPVVPGADQTLTITLQKEHFPFFTKGRAINVSKIELLMKAKRTGEYELVFDATDLSGNPIASSLEIQMLENPVYDNMQTATLTANNYPAFGTFNVFSPMGFRFRYFLDVSNPQKYNQIDTDPVEISDLFLVLKYELRDL